LFVLAFVLGGAVLREVNLLILLAGLMIGPLLFSWRLAKATLRDITVRREFPRNVGAGERFTVELIVANERERLGSWALNVEDHLERANVKSKEDRAKAQVFVPNIAARCETSVRYHCELSRRGRYEFGPITVGTRFPFGFLNIFTVYPAPGEIVVCPRIGHVTRAWKKLVESQIDGTHHARRQRGTSEGDYFGLRDWRQGDSRRWIHWRSTAKRGELAVIEFEQQRNLDIAMVLDLWAPQNASDKQRGLVELALSFAATSTVQICRQGANRLLVAIAGNRFQNWSATSSQVFCQDMLEQFAIAQAGNSNQWLNENCATLAAITGDPRVIVVSTRPQEMEMSKQLQGAIDRHRGGRSALVWIDVGSEELARYFHA
jgi:uncharacterized protein (DUF58 family)